MEPIIARLHGRQSQSYYHSKIGNVSRDMQELTICSRLLATQNPPIGIYFISEDIFTLASYYTHDLRDTKFFPSEDWKILPDEEQKGLITDD